MNSKQVNIEVKELSDKIKEVLNGVNLVDATNAIHEVRCDLSSFAQGVATSAHKKAIYLLDNQHDA